MKIPARLRPLYEDGLIDEVLYQLMSGKEATVYVVRSGDETRCAKVYKEAAKRSFKQAAQVPGGSQREKNSRRARAMEKGSKFGRKQMEEAWQNAEVDALYRVAQRRRAGTPALRLLRRRAADGTGHGRRGRGRAAAGRCATCPPSRRGKITP